VSHLSASVPYSKTIPIVVDGSEPGCTNNSRQPLLPDPG
jgi:hypothetical protein